MKSPGEKAAGAPGQSAPLGTTSQEVVPCDCAGKACLCPRVWNGVFRKHSLPPGLPWGRASSPPPGAWVPTIAFQQVFTCSVFPT